MINTKNILLVGIGAILLVCMALAVILYQRSQETESVSQVTPSPQNTETSNTLVNQTPETIVIQNNSFEHDSYQFSKNPNEEYFLIHFQNESEEPTTIRAYMNSRDSQPSDDITIENNTPSPMALLVGTYYFENTTSKDLTTVTIADQ